MQANDGPVTGAQKRAATLCAIGSGCLNRFQIVVVDITRLIAPVEYRGFEAIDIGVTLP